MQTTKHFDHMRPYSSKTVLLRELYWRRSDDGKRRPLSAGSGLVKTGSGLWVIGDDLHHLVYLEMGAPEGNGLRIFDGDLPDNEKERKVQKPDLEAIIDLSPERNGRKEVLLFPSGSTQGRMRGKYLLVNQFGQIEIKRDIDFSRLMAKLRDRVPELNIEGGAVLEEKMILFQRGNGSEAINGFFTIDANSFIASTGGSQNMSELNLEFALCPLDKWNEVRLTFTDASVFVDRVYFAAAAEATASTYDDGSVVGSCIGFLNEQKEPIELLRIPDQKVEGIVILEDKEDYLELYAITDADMPNQPSQLLHIEFSRSSN